MSEALSPLHFTETQIGWLHSPGDPFQARADDDPLLRAWQTGVAVMRTLVERLSDVEVRGMVGDEDGCEGIITPLTAP